MYVAPESKLLVNLANVTTASATTTAPVEEEEEPTMGLGDCLE